MRTALLAALLAAGTAGVAGGCTAPPRHEGARLAAAIEAERTGRFAGAPEQQAAAVTVHSELFGMLPPAFAAEAAAVRERFRTLLRRRDAPVPLSILVFASPGRLQRVLGVSPGVHGLALTSRDAPVIVLAAGEGDTALRRHLRHEITHIVSDLSSNPDLPPDRAAWVEEGLAYLLEWSQEGEPPRPSLGLLEILQDFPPPAAEVPDLVSAHYRPRGDAPTMRRLAAAAATLVHFYWDRAARAGSVDVGQLLVECARKSPAALRQDGAAWERHWRRALHLSRTGASARLSAQHLDAAARTVRGLDRGGLAAELDALADAVAQLGDAARTAAGPGGRLRPGVAAPARSALQRLARTLTEHRPFAQGSPADRQWRRSLLVARKQLETAIAQVELAGARAGR